MARFSRRLAAKAPGPSGATPPGTCTPRHCWWNWPRRLESVIRLPDLEVRWLLPGPWLLPGHGCCRAMAAARPWLLPGHGGRRAFAAGAWADLIERTLAFFLPHP